MTKPLDEPMYPHRSVTSRRADVIKLLTEHPEYSDRRIARIAVVGRELVMAIRRNMERLNRIEGCHAHRRVGADGKLYKRLPRRKQSDATTS